MCFASLSACVAPSEENTSRAPESKGTFSKEEYKDLGYKEFTYKASGKSYTLFVQQKAKGNFGLDKVQIYVSQGTPFTATSADDTEVQNTVRDAYRFLGLCPQGLHPGLVNLAYGPLVVGNVPIWNVYLKCTKTVQANV